MDCDDRLKMQSNEEIRIESDNLADSGTLTFVSNVPKFNPIQSQSVPLPQY